MEIAGTQVGGWITEGRDQKEYLEIKS